MTTISEVFNRWQTIPIPQYLGEGERGRCIQCGSTIATSIWKAGEAENGDPAAFTACDALCAALIMDELLKVSSYCKD